MSIPDLIQTPSAPQRIGSREKLRGWASLSILLCVLAVPLYLVSCLADRIRFKPDIDRAGGNVLLRVQGPKWFQDLVGRDYD